MPTLFGPIENIATNQDELKKITLEKETERGNNIASKSDLLKQGQSTVFLPVSEYAYYFSLYQIVGRYIEQLLKNAEQPSVLEIGCGTGWGSYYLANKYPQTNFLATNIDKQSIQYATTIYSQPNLHFKVANGLKQQEFKNTADLVFFNEVLEHLTQNDQATLLRQSIKSLKNRGVLVFSTPSKEFSLGLPTLGWMDHQKEYSSKKELLNFLNSIKNHKWEHVEVNRLIGKNYARKMRIRTWISLPFLLIGKLIKPNFSSLRNFAETRKRTGKKDESAGIDLQYVPGTKENVSMHTLALIGAIEKGYKK